MRYEIVKATPEDAESITYMHWYQYRREHGIDLFWPDEYERIVRMMNDPAGDKWFLIARDTVNPKQCYGMVFVGHVKWDTTRNTDWITLASSLFCYSHAPLFCARDLVLAAALDADFRPDKRIYMITTARGQRTFYSRIGFIQDTTMFSDNLDERYVMWRANTPDIIAALGRRGLELQYA